MHGESACGDRWRSVFLQRCSVLNNEGGHKDVSRSSDRGSTFASKSDPEPIASATIVATRWNDWPGRGVASDFEASVLAVSLADSAACQAWRCKRAGIGVEHHILLSGYYTGETVAHLTRFIASIKRVTKSELAR